MLVSVDPRRGSKELLAPLTKLGVNAVEEQLAFGDVAFVGEGPRGRPIPVGVERKALGDLLTCIVDKRFAGHQLNGLHACYEDVYLVVEGEYSYDAEGYFVTKRFHGRGERPTWDRPPGRAWRWSAIKGWLMTMSIQGGVKIVETDSLHDTALFVRNLASWYTEPWEAHHSLKVFHSKARPFSYAVKRPETEFAATLPGIGWEKAQRAVDKFKTIETMVLADKEEWLEIEGIGPTIAEKIIKRVRG